MFEASMRGLFSSAVMLIAYFIVKQGVYQAPLMVPLPVIIYLAWNRINQKYESLANSLPMSIALQHDFAELRGVSDSIAGDSIAGVFTAAGDVAGAALDATEIVHNRDDGTGKASEPFGKRIHEEFTEEFCKQPNASAHIVAYPYPYRIHGKSLFDENGNLSEAYYDDLEDVYSFLESARILNQLQQMKGGKPREESSQQQEPQLRFMTKPPLDTLEEVPEEAIVETAIKKSSVKKMSIDSRLADPTDPVLFKPSQLEVAPISISQTSRGTNAVRMTNDSAGKAAKAYYSAGGAVVAPAKALPLNPIETSSNLKILRAEGTNKNGIINAGTATVNTLAEPKDGARGAPLVGKKSTRKVFPIESESEDDSSPPRGYVQEAAPKTDPNRDLNQNLAGGSKLVRRVDSSSSRSDSSTNLLSFKAERKLLPKIAPSTKY